MSPDKRAIAIFDSGLGGLTVFKAIKHLLPHESIIYLADNERVPYGPLSSETIVQYTREAISFLEKLNVKMVVLACHTASVCAENEKFSLPIHGMIHGGVQAVRVAGAKKIGILGTEKTIQSGIYQNAFADLEVISIACPKLAAQIEAQAKNLEDVVQEYIKPIQNEVDAILLACTHYPLIVDVFKKLLGEVPILDPAEKTALEIKASLQGKKLLNTEGNPVHQFYVTKDAKNFGKNASFLLQEEISPTQISLKLNIL